MNQFVNRVANYVANEIVIKGLANSKTFQKFAVRTNKQYEEVAKHGTENLAKTLEEMAAQQAGKTAAAATSNGSTALQPPKPPLRGIPGFFVAFFKELRKDVVGG